MTIVYSERYWTYLDTNNNTHACTLTFLMRDFKLLIFLCGHLIIFSSLHLFFNTVNPTFISFAALVIGTSKCFCISSNSNKAVFFLPFVLFSSSLLLDLAYSLWIITEVSLKSLPRVSKWAKSLMVLIGTTWSNSYPEKKPEWKSSKSWNSMRGSCLVWYGNGSGSDNSKRLSSGGSSKILQKEHKIETLHC